MSMTCMPEPDDPLVGAAGADDMDAARCMSTHSRSEASCIYIQADLIIIFLPATMADTPSTSGGGVASKAAENWTKAKQLIQTGIEAVFIGGNVKDVWSARNAIYEWSVGAEADVDVTTEVCEMVCEIYDRTCVPLALPYNTEALHARLLSHTCDTETVAEFIAGRLFMKGGEKLRLQIHMNGIFKTRVFLPNVSDVCSWLAAEMDTPAADSDMMWDIFFYISQEGMLELLHDAIRTRVFQKEFATLEDVSAYLRIIPGELLSRVFLVEEVRRVFVEGRLQEANARLVSICEQKSIEGIKTLADLNLCEEMRPAVVQLISTADSIHQLVTRVDWLLNVADNIFGGHAFREMVRNATETSLRERDGDELAGRAAAYLVNHCDQLTELQMEALCFICGRAGIFDRDAFNIMLRQYTWKRLALRPDLLLTTIEGMCHCISITDNSRVSDLYGALRKITPVSLLASYNTCHINFTAAIGKWFDWKISPVPLPVDWATEYTQGKRLFEKQYKRQYKQRKLTWIDSMCTALVFFPDSNSHALLSLPQLKVLADIVAESEEPAAKRARPNDVLHEQHAERALRQLKRAGIVRNGALARFRQHDASMPLAVARLPHKIVDRSSKTDFLLQGYQLDAAVIRMIKAHSPVEEGCRGLEKLIDSHCSLGFRPSPLQLADCMERLTEREYIRIGKRGEIIYIP
jgi:hypothetical protein